jgi:hypothetical protein
VIGKVDEEEPMELFISSVLKNNISIHRQMV